jgi:hypothetical protein
VLRAWAKRTELGAVIYADGRGYTRVSESALRYLSRNLSTSRADSKARHSLTKLAEKLILLAEVMTAELTFVTLRRANLKTFIGAAS